MKSNVLVTGGAGYIGSHTVLELLNTDKYDVVVVDNLCNSSEESLKRVEKLTGKTIQFHKVDLLDKPATEELFKRYKFSSIIHFAGLKSVGESVSQPLKYYRNNIVTTLNLLDLVEDYGVENFVFSSSATVYGDPESVPVAETAKLGHPTNPYGKTKSQIEEILRDVAHVRPSLRIALLRYFNPAGAHESGDIGEDPQGIPNNLMPYITQVAVGRREKLSVFGNDYDTKDGTGVRDYIHVVDLARGHVAALQWLRGHAAGKGCCEAVNLGTGHGYSVLDMVNAVSNVVGKPIPYEFAPRRPGDVASCFADASKARELFGWTANFGLHEMCEHAWRWQSQNPHGYRNNP